MDKEDLLLMQERSKWNSIKRYLSPGDLVIIVDNTKEHMDHGPCCKDSVKVKVFWVKLQPV